MNRFLDWLGEFFSARLGLLPLLGLLLIGLNLILQFYPGPDSGWFVASNLLLHIGLILSIIGFLIIRVLR